MPIEDVRFSRQLGHHVRNIYIVKPVRECPLRHDDGLSGQLDTVNQNAHLTSGVLHPPDHDCDLGIISGNVSLLPQPRPHGREG